MRLPAGGVELTQHFLWAAARSLGMSFANVDFVLGGTHLGAIIAGVHSQSDDLHFQFDEGPAIDACATKAVVEVPDMALATGRWPAYAPAALQIGIRSCICVPLEAGGRVGLVLFVGHEDGLTGMYALRPQLARVTRVAQKLVGHPETTDGDSVRRHIDETVGRRAAVYQASGALAATLSTDMSAALSSLRLRAWAEDRSLQDLSADLLSPR